MGFAETFFGVVGEARRPTLELVASLDFAPLAKPWLVMLLHIIRATGPVLGVAVGAARALGDSALVEYFGNKQEDEDGHDRALADDLNAAGVTDEELHRAPINPFVAEMVGRQYYLIDFAHPAAYLGYIGLLEGFPPTLEQLGELERISGLSHEAFRTARMHASVDVAHREDLAAQLDAVPGELRPLVLSNGIRCAQLQFLALQTLSLSVT